MAPSSKRSVMIQNLRREVVTGKTRSMNPRGLTDDEKVQRKALLEEELAKQEAEAASRRLKIIEAISAHVTSETKSQYGA